MIRVALLLLLAFPVRAEYYEVWCKRGHADKVYVQVKDYVHGWDYCGCSGRNAHKKECKLKHRDAQAVQNEIERQKRIDSMVEMLLGKPQRSKEREEAMQKIIEKEMD